MQTELAVAPALAAMERILQELAELEMGARQLERLYGDYAEASDLTFIKILEERYRLLVGEIHDIRTIVSDVRANCEKMTTEASGYGG